MTVRIEAATPRDAPDLAAMVGELLEEIMDAIGVRAFHFDLAASTERAWDFLQEGVYHAFVARHRKSAEAVGFITLCESHALYAEGAFGIIPELYVRPAHRRAGVGESLVRHARDFAAARGWTRLEVTTPPLPEFTAALRFYEWQGFSITGGHKLKLPLGGTG